MCLECLGGVASCCDGIVVEVAPLMAYFDHRFPERACDRCGKPYRGPAVYCSLKCAMEDA
jgi:DNA polymerase III epsilon subunit-like protein